MISSGSAIHSTALIVHAHPEPSSFCSTQARVADEALRAQGYHVDRIDLYARDWNPVLDRGEFAPFDGAFKPQRAQEAAIRNGTLDPAVDADLTTLLRADLLVLSFPLWWFSVPAILKGWIDRVFVMGAVFGGDYGLFDAAALAGNRALVLTTTGGASGSFTSGGTFGEMDMFLFHIHRGMLEFVGYDALQPVITHGPARLDDSQRADALAGVREAFASIDTRAVARTVDDTRAP